MMDADVGEIGCAMTDGQDISPQLGEALVAEYDHRVNEKKLYGFLPFFTFIALKL